MPHNVFRWPRVQIVVEVKAVTRLCPSAVVTKRQNPHGWLFPHGRVFISSQVQGVKLCYAIKVGGSNDSYRKLIKADGLPFQI